MEFAWDPQKALKNLRKHGVSFNEAATVFDDPLSITVADPEHSEDEDRYIIVGMSKRGRVIIVSHAERGDRIRIISARELDREEREAYETGNY
ncbi:MAG: BrnT family toxin [Caldilineaceae bacterium]